MRDAPAKQKTGKQRSVAGKGKRERQASRSQQLATARGQAEGTEADEDEGATLKAPLSVS